MCGCLASANSRRYAPFPHTCYALDFIPAESLGSPAGSYTLRDAHNAAHMSLPGTELLFDTGAMLSVLRPPCLGILQRVGSIPGVSIMGVGVGAGVIQPQAAGFSDIAFPGFPSPPR